MVVFNGNLVVQKTLLLSFISSDLRTSFIKNFYRVKDLDKRDLKILEIFLI